MEPNVNLGKGTWDESYKTYKLTVQPRDYILVDEAYKFFSKDGDGKEVFEIGIYPGRFVWHFGAMGYTISGLDETPFIKNLRPWFQQHNFKVGDLIQGTIEDYKPDHQYDVVFSSGFVEHFTNYKELIAQHVALCKKGGHIYITAPNFRGWIQYMLHYLLDKKNLQRHYVPSMNVRKWQKVLEQEGCTVLKKGYIGGWDFWVDEQPRNRLQQFLLKYVHVFTRRMYKKRIWNNFLYSPECVIIAKKN